MAIKNFISTGLLLLLFVGVSAQGSSVSVKVVDTKNVTTVVNRFSSSSSSSGDFSIKVNDVNTVEILD